MLDDLDFYLKKWTNPVRHAVIKDALLVLEQYGETGTSTAISLRLENSSTLPANDTLDIIEETLRNGLKGVLLAMNLNLEGTVQDLTLILRGFHTLTTTEEHEYVINELDIGGDPFDVINELLEYADFNAALAWQNCVTVNTMIADGLLQRLRAVHEEAIANESVLPDALTTETQTRFARLRFFMGKYPESLATKVIMEDHAPVGLPLKALMGMYRSAIALLDPQQPLVLASSLLGLVMISDTTTDRLLSVAKDLIDDIWTEREVVASVEQAMDTMALDIGRSA